MPCFGENLTAGAVELTTMSRKRKKRIIRQSTCLETRLAARIATGAFFVVFLSALILYVVTWANYQRCQDFFTKFGIETQGQVVSLVGNGGHGRRRTILHPVIEYSDSNGVPHRFESMYDSRFHANDCTCFIFARFA